MAIVYRTNGAWGSGKGADLTPAEVDGNFYDHDQRIDTLETSPPSPVEISNITQDGSQFTVHLSDATTYGPFTLPVTEISWEGEWQAATTYHGNDIVSVSGDGLYLVLQNHTSEGSFDANAGDTDGDYYQQVFGLAGLTDLSQSGDVDYPTAGPSEGDILVYRSGAWAPEQRNEVKEISAATYELVLADSGKYLRFTNGGGCALEVPSNAEVPFPIGVPVHLRQTNSAAVSITGSTDVLINGITGFNDATGGEGAVVTLLKVGADEWDLFGLLDETT